MIRSMKLITLIVLMIIVGSRFSAYTVTYYVQDKGYIDLDQTEVQRFLQLYPNAQLVETPRDPDEQENSTKPESALDEVANESTSTENKETRTALNKQLTREFIFLFIVFLYIIYRGFYYPPDHVKEGYLNIIKKAKTAVSMTKTWSLITCIYCLLWPVVMYAFLLEFDSELNAASIISFVLGGVYFFIYYLAHLARKTSLITARVKFLYIALFPILMSLINLILVSMFYSTDYPELNSLSIVYDNIGVKGIGIMVALSTLQCLSAYFYLRKLDIPSLKEADQLWLTTMKPTDKRKPHSVFSIKNYLTNHKVLLILFTSSLLIILGLIIDDLDEGFFTLLRIIVFLSCLYISFIIYRVFHNKWKTYLIYVLIAVLYNPIVKVSFDDVETWTIINIISAVLIVIPIFNKKFIE